MIKIIINEFIDWIEGILSFLPGKLGTLIRLLWYRYRWKKLVNVRVRPLSQFVSPKNIQFEGGASLGKGAFFTAEGGEINIGAKFSQNKSPY